MLITKVYTLICKSTILFHISKIFMQEIHIHNRDSKNYNIDVFAYFITNRLKME